MTMVGAYANFRSYLIILVILVPFLVSMGILSKIGGTGLCSSCRRQWLHPSRLDGWGQDFEARLVVAQCFWIFFFECFFGWKLQAAPHISLLCWVSYPLTGAAKNDISLTTVPDLIREGGKQCQTLALPGSMPPLLCHDSFQVTMLCAKLIQDVFFCKVERVWPQIWQPSRISWCMPSC